MIEDDKKLCDAISFQLKKKGFTIDCCQNGEDGLRWIRQQAHDLILLDRMLPGVSGTRVLELARRDGVTVPVILITALGTIKERVEGLDAGADDYLVKPFAVEELLARIRALNRRPHQWENISCITLGDISYDGTAKVLKGKDGTCSLSKKEADLMESLLKNPRQVMPRSVLLSRVWGPDAPVEEGNLDNYIYFLRRRLKSVGSKMGIRTVRGVGYQLEGTEDVS